MPDQLIIKKQVSTSIPSKYGPFELSLFTSNQDNKEHLVLTYGVVKESENVLVRIHSECLTGDILGSLRCDCGEQLQISMSKIASEGRGIIIYLRQEGRGIGLLEKLKTYNLQSLGKDTIDANLALGHKEDERSYEIAAKILKDLQIKSVRLLTNNPKKLEALIHYNLSVTARIPIKGAVSTHNAFYLLTKIKKMQHFSAKDELQELFAKCNAIEQNHRPLVTLAYAQSLDGAISQHGKERIVLSSQDSLVMTHQLRSQNDAILVGIGTIISDDPLLTVRYIKGKNPLPIIVDSSLRIPMTAQILRNSKSPIIFTTNRANAKKRNILEAMSIKIIEIESTPEGKVNFNIMLKTLLDLGIKTLMVEGGREVITNFVRENQVDKVVITLAPIFMGGISVLSKQVNTRMDFPRLKNIIQYKLGTDIIIIGDIERK